ncbi:MAG: outer membrane lipid asymmetry maintenance protein MlaD [Alteromonadaceae bacterium]|uniref:outer membrane lipid asymmetry maintenance protein MlaD n=1 Tax=unclassified Marinobacter TaxID=83889 RepID=UPI000C5DA2FE|nr:outer membrane lipid asymmetry maintenance protein MlaD [Marinobacter sp. BGYM27]MAA66117.1 outer membrane lipid asymmetry maintenance protein MlaD [Alteromonadaceae bacterium]MBH86374.1 outer membrane lipid asymmetry maintenance protein MlaD [Alteromonadaceae bacterium]MDG5499251.1 outer membrane lipid asymmetry maintenance protein MlaD [Marinobacter sp. BGYM27]|tara:strand:- start:35879 stop:36328 length:450 start_codon:yes stop_codon:yes gene_type:complete
MRQRTVEIVVGGFVLVGLGALLVLALQVSGLSPKSAESSYRVYANFNDIGGLSVRGQVSLAGVTIGRITDIQLDPETYQARVEMAINESVDIIPSDSSAIIRTAGLLGEKYIDVSVGADETYMKQGDTFYGTQSALNIERLISNFASGK